MDKCVRCGRSEEEVKLFDGIYVNDMVKICERCGLMAGVALIKRPNPNQLKESEKPAAVRERLSRMAHISQEQQKEKSIYDRIRELDTNPEIEQPEDLVFKLVDNFHWVIQTERRRKSISTKQLAESINESEEAIKLLEKGIIPSKSIDLIRGIEQFLNIRLIKRDMIDAIEESKRQEKIQLTPVKKAVIGNNVVLSREISVREIPKENKYSFLADEKTDFKMKDLQRQNKRIDDDMEFEKKTSYEVGEEQMENFGKENMEKIKRKLPEENKNKVPSIHDLMKKKEEREKAMTGKDIEFFEE